MTVPKRTCVEVLTTGRCRKKAIEGSDRCIFHDPEVWKHKPELLRKKIREQIKRGDFNFEGYHFPEIEFSNIIKRQEFKQPVNFENAHFHGKTSFGGAIFSGMAWFTYAKFSEDALFTNAKFFGDARFISAKFSEKA